MFAKFYQTQPLCRSLNFENRLQLTTNKGSSISLLQSFLGQQQVPSDPATPASVKIKSEPEKQAMQGEGASVPATASEGEGSRRGQTGGEAGTGGGGDVPLPWRRASSTAIFLTADILHDLHQEPPQENPGPCPPQYLPTNK